MNDLTEIIADGYKPFKALLFYRGKKEEYYIESYDIGLSGRAINAHPLSVDESQQLADALDNSEELKATYLRGNGMFPQNLLYLNSEKDGFAVWHTPSKQVNLFFKADLGIADGMAQIPPMLWKAGKHSLQVFAMKTDDRPIESEQLFHAPFFNVYESGAVCMGNVKKQIPNGCSLIEFMSLWEKFYFNSTFSHTLNSGAVDGEKTVALWKRQMENQTAFPLAKLVKSKISLKTLLK
ncbi:PRTRC system protein B [Pedobacter sp. LMG 31464]|uniref:PRTRC system protein B n=1 Tax=Pedobacter planticolens TaxID=2679964 RepID=A0A923DXA0_9SPHI|nr:PRTRC system protein B [Pedobacter planticolens]MBB2145729.1 PRTRC system protein B [Pedobacter planticolens]